MKLGILTTTHVRSQAALGSLRLLVDSIRRYIGRGEYETLLIADDCSPAYVEPFYQWCREIGAAEVYRMGPPRLPYWTRKYRPINGPTSYGHAVGLMAGFHALRERGCTHAWVIDGDCVILRSGLLVEALRSVNHERVTVVTDYFGGRPDDSGLPQFADARDRVFVSGTGHLLNRKAALPCKEAWALYGFPVLFCAVVDIGRETIYGPMENGGWVNQRWGARLFRRGDRVGYYPFFQGGGVFHLGFGFTKPNIGIEGQTYGNTWERESDVYGGRARGYHHAGWLRLRRSTAEHTAWLETMAARPLGEPIEMPQGVIGKPGPSPEPTGDDPYIRPLAASDLSALRTFDGSSEATRWFTWGPCGAERTRDFLDMASQEPDRFYALVGRREGLIGWGELRPLGQGRGGIAYAVLPRFWRQGYGKRIFNHLVEAAYNQHDYGTVEVAIDPGNEASVHVLRSRHDFSSDWRLTEDRPYTLRGELRQRVVYERQFPPRFVPDDPVAAATAREAYLFDTLGIWRPGMVGP